MGNQTSYQTLHKIGMHLRLCLSCTPIMVLHRVLPTLVGSDRLQPPLSNFYHYSGLFYHHSQRVKSAEVPCLMQFDSTLANV